MNRSIGPNFELFSNIPTEFEMLQETWDAVGSWYIYCTDIKFRTLGDYEV